MPNITWLVTHDVTNQGTDRAQLGAMGKQTQAAIGTEKLTALADRGYYAGPEMLFGAALPSRRRISRDTSALVRTCWLKAV
jgi:hypothetical protein